jgi:hypothetical protein
MSAPNVLLRNGMTRVSLKPGDQVTINGLLALGAEPLPDGTVADRRFRLSGTPGAQTLPDGTIATLASTILKADSSRVFDRSALSAAKPCNAAAAARPPSCITVQAAPQ